MNVSDKIIQRVIARKTRGWAFCIPPDKQYYLSIEEEVKKDASLLSKETFLTKYEVYLY